MRAMFPSRLSLTAPAVVLALGFVSTNALAHHAKRDGQHHRHRHHLVRHDRWAPTGPYASPGASPGVAGPGYIFVPGKGILGESCNLPTSTCPNDLRDIR